MTMATIKIYLNDGPDSFFGFKNDFANDPQLTLVMTFDIKPDHYIDPVLSNPMLPLLEWVFGETNIGEFTVFSHRWRDAGLRSVSVGDVVQIGETAWSCESVGWKTITTEELQKAMKVHTS